MIAKQTKPSSNMDIELDGVPLISVFDELKKQSQAQPVPFDSPDISIIKERSPCTIFAKEKYSNPLG